MTLQSPVISLMFPTFYLPEPVLQYTSVNLAHGAIGEDWTSCEELDTSSIGDKTVLCTDTAGNALEVNYSVIYNWSSFFEPVDDLAINPVNAGGAIPVKFSLSGDQGLSIFEQGYPRSE